MTKKHEDIDKGVAMIHYELGKHHAAITRLRHLKRRLIQSHVTFRIEYLAPGHEGAFLIWDKLKGPDGDYHWSLSYGHIGGYGKPVSTLSPSDSQKGASLIGEFLKNGMKEAQKLCKEVPR